MSETTNAKIDAATIRYDRGTFLTIHLTLAYGGGAMQGYGGYVFCAPIHDEAGNFLRREIEGPQFGRAVDAILRIAGVESWDDLAGQPVRVRGGGWGGKVEAIGHFTDDKWFSFAGLFPEEKA